MRLVRLGLSVAACLAVGGRLARGYLDPTGGGIIMSLLLAGTASPIILGRLLLGRFRRQSGEPDAEPPEPEEASK